MIKSIRYFLLISLLLSITIASAINGIANYILDEQVVQPYLDAQLIRISNLINLMSEQAYKHPEVKSDIINALQQPFTQQKFLFQVWDNHGKLFLQSANEFNKPLFNAPFGFSDQQIGNNTWRVYSVFTPTYQLKIIVGELSHLRSELADDIARSNANILLITYPIFGLLVWLIVSFALRSITSVTGEISNRASTYLEPVHLATIPKEIKPLVAELNQLFVRLKLAFERNKRFAADAAHELRTPLAALKTHVQVALNVTDTQERNKALKKVIESVDRSSHVVAQLLTLSRLGEEEGLTDVHVFDLHKLATEIIAYLAPYAIDKKLEIELSDPPDYPYIMGNETAVGILIRNIVDNAIRYTPAGGFVKVEILNSEDHVIFRTTDTGSGIPPELHERVFERFYRILGNKATGSGLGLAIVSQIAALHEAKLKLKTPANGTGLQFDVAFPKYHE